ncbi:MAG TPA: 1,4-alpha-glucan branching protein GlgB [Verrucomicrobiota bacterium]|nr:1,4-alpha-glucan branching protein GlgB [Verrucomicrobiota bacterium]HNT15047.1 1,4-alpha-glucan branching protein GlgB [Verrucomicrobiota bacterium]
MILAPDELRKLVELKHRSPHSILGLHVRDDPPGLVARVFDPRAVRVVLRPVAAARGPTMELARIHAAGVFEGAAEAVPEVFKYELVITDEQGESRTLRDPYSFLPTLTDADLYLLGKGDERKLHDKLGAQLRTVDGVSGTSFAVWAPNAQRVSVVGSFNHWDGRCHQMRSLGVSGIWEIFIPGVGEGALYKYEIRDRHHRVRLKADPLGFFMELPPKQASIVWNNQKFKWTDGPWLARRAKSNPLQMPVSTYELHLGSWRKKTQAESLGYRELAAPLIEYLQQMGFTHVEFMPLAEHAFYPSWGYQVTGYFAPTSRYGTPEDLQYLINELHRADIGVIVDWVPAHFPRDDWALARFDGTGLYEHEDPRKGAHQDWGTLIFNYGRNEVANFLIANALFWCERYHIDGLRVDAVASMLYLDYSRKPGQWIPNRYGGRENLEAIDFLRRFNHLVHTEFPGVMTIAEESTAWPQVTRPPYVGGLGFSMKWNMGWMHDTLEYFQRDPVHRKYHQHNLTFAMLYQYHENFILPLSHDEVVHGKGSLLRRMPGDEWQRFANLRVLLGYQWLFPGKKLLFMGGELGQGGEWNANGEVEWHLLNAGPYHRGIQQMVADLNRLYRAQPGLWQADFDPQGFQWIDASDNQNSVMSFIRREPERVSELVVILNLTPVPRHKYRIGMPRPGLWREVFNSDAALYGGGNLGNFGRVQAEDLDWHNQSYSAEFTLPPLSILVFQPGPPYGAEDKERAVAVPVEEKTNASTLVNSSTGKSAT